MRSLEDVWREVEEHSFIRIDNDKGVEYAIFEGCKIQKMIDGRIDILNTRAKDEHYKPIGALSLIKFLKQGFVAGAHHLAIKTLEEKVEKLNKQIQRKNIRGYNVKKKKSKRTEILNKIHEHYIKLELLTIKTTTQ
tara:strand:+ start:383 stop:790 length:408 start_codon:yes stop_codon:yes gene_type:complete